MFRTEEQIKAEWSKCVMEQNEALNDYFTVYKSTPDKHSNVIKAAKVKYDQTTAKINERLRMLKTERANMEVMLFC